jgi:hypothetical protein
MQRYEGFLYKQFMNAACLIASALSTENKTSLR